MAAFVAAVDPDPVSLDIGERLARQRGLSKPWGAAEARADVPTAATAKPRALYRPELDDPALRQ